MKSKTILILFILLFSAEFLFMGYTTYYSEIHHYADQHNINFPNPGDLIHDYLSNLKGFINPNPISPYKTFPHKVNSEVSINWKNIPLGDEYPANWNENIRSVPLNIDYKILEIAPFESKRRFEVFITFSMNKSDSLYKPGERIHIDMWPANSNGPDIRGDIIEFISHYQALVDDNQQKTVFIIRIASNKDKRHFFTFGGGKYRYELIQIPSGTIESKKWSNRFLACVEIRLLEHKISTKQRIIKILLSIPHELFKNH